MSNWNTPKEDWGIDDGMLASDANRIEGNINFLLNTYQLLGTIDFQTLTDLVVNTDAPVAKITIIVPTGQSIKILRASYYTSSTNLKYKVSLNDGTNTTTWTATSNSSEESPNFTLYNNTSGSNATVTVTIYVYKTLDIVFDAANGCLLLLSKETSV